MFFGVSITQFFSEEGSALLYPAGNLFIPVAHGHLEAILKEPRTTATLSAAAQPGLALVLHPHPLGGGTMHNKVVFRLARVLGECGLTTLRFNFRGVGASTGTHDEGRGERDDARAALDYLTNRYPDQPVLLAGFSFGARFGLEVGLEEARVTKLIGLGTPVDKYDFAFLQGCRKPLLLVHGAKDEFGDARRLQEIAGKLPTEAQVQVSIIPDAGHFFEGHLDEMAQVVIAWIKQWAGEQAE